MINVDSLVAVGLLHELADKTAKGAVSFSQTEDPSEAYEKIVYDDRQPENGEDDENGFTAYPVICGYIFAGEVQRLVVVRYDSVLEGLRVRYCVHEDPALNYVDFYVRDEETGGHFRIENGVSVGVDKIE